MATKSCSRCREPFACGAKEPKCWCQDLPAIAPFTGDDCLCPKCLRGEIAARVGDCLGCRHARTLATKGGSAIFLCGRSEREPAYPKYPRLPKTACAGRQD